MGFIGVQPATVPLTTSDITNDIVNSDKIADDSISEEHIDNTAITGHSAITSLADTDKFLVSDASDSNNLKYVEKQYLGGGNNKPILSVGLSSTQTLSDNTWATIVFQTEILDADGIYNNSTGVATPTAGTYLMIFAANVGGGGGSTLNNAGVKFLVGSTVTAEQTMNEADNRASYGNIVTSYIQAFDGSTTVACQAYNDVTSGTPSVYGTTSPRFGATFQMVKLIS
jgi:hypothetical protein